MGTKPAEINGFDATPKKLGVLLGAFNAETDPRLIELAEYWKRFSENEKTALLTVARGMVK